MADLRRRAAIHAALADVTRLAVVHLLATGDAAASEISAALGTPSNLLAHHVRTLERAGLVTRRRSEGDGRRSYLSLASRAEWLLGEAAPGAAVPARRVLFVCTANTARSHLAAAAWRRSSAVPSASAGTHPGERVHPGAVAAAGRHGLDLPAVTPRLLADAEQPGDLLVTVCDRAHEELGGRDWAHWSVPDPVAAGTPQAFDLACAELAARVRTLATVVAA